MTYINAKLIVLLCWGLFRVQWESRDSKVSRLRSKVICSTVEERTYGRVRETIRKFILLMDSRRIKKKRKRFYKEIRVRISVVLLLFTLAEKVALIRLDVNRSPTHK